MNPKEAEAVQALKHEAPATVREVRKLMGFLSYYRSYIPDFSRTAKPLYELPKEKGARPQIRSVATFPSSTVDSTPQRDTEQDCGSADKSTSHGLP